MIRLSVSSKHPVDPLVASIARELDRELRQLDVRYFLAGAMARDLLLKHVYGIDIERATRDVDFAVAVRNWDQFARVKQALLNTGQFFPDTKKDHQLLFKPANGTGCPLDILPFGEIEAPPASILWPDDHIMNVTGYEEALENAVLLEIDATVTSPVVSLPGLAMLKLFAWEDRHNKDTKDALDIALLLRRYEDAGNRDRIYDVMELVDYDARLAAARLLGNDVAAIASAETRDAATGLLAERSKFDRLVTHMSAAFNYEEEPMRHAEAMLEQFRDGLNT